MSLFGMMRTGISGMEGQAGRLSSISDNVANSSTVGYKRFETLLTTQTIDQAGGQHYSGGVSAYTRQLVSQQGVLQFTSSASDLAVNGEGFFIVGAVDGSTQLTRAGSFVPDAEGRLINAAGTYLLGYSYSAGTPTPVANSFAGLEPVRIDVTELVAVPTDNGMLSFNLPSAAPAATAPLPSSNMLAAGYTEKTSITVYDSLGGNVLLDVYMTKTGLNQWEVAVYNQADASPDASFPYASGPLTVETLDFDPANGQLAGPVTSLSVAVPGGSTANIDLTGSTQLATEYVISDVAMNGNAPSTVERIDIGSDGTLLAVYSNGDTRPLYRIPLATVPAPDMLQARTGNIFTVTNDSGDVTIGFPNDSNTGGIVSGALETSTVDIAKELTDMIEAQRSYTANSKVFQTGSELTEVVINLKR